MKTIRWLLCLGMFITTIQFTSAQLVEQTDAIIYLKDGIVVRGTIISLIPDVSVTIELSDGEQVLLAMQDVREIKRETTRVRTRYIPIPTYNQKYPGLALGLSFLMPGLGQMYNEDYESCCLFFGGNLVGWALLVIGAEQNADSYSGNDGIGLMLAGAGVMVGNWLYSMYDAHSSAILINRVNAHNQQKQLSIRPIIDNTGRFGGAVALRF